MRRPKPPSLAEQLARLVPGFDRLVRDAAAAPLSVRDYDRLEGEAQRIAAALVAAFRGDTRDRRS